jgi:hypothetical protein
MLFALGALVGTVIRYPFLPPHTVTLNAFGKMVNIDHEGHGQLHGQLCSGRFWIQAIRKAGHRLRQLRIYFVRDDHDIG